MCAWCWKDTSFGFLLSACKGRCGGLRSVVPHTWVNVALVTRLLLFQQELRLFHPGLWDPPWQGLVPAGWGYEWRSLSPSWELCLLRAASAQRKGLPLEILSKMLPGLAWPCHWGSSPQLNHLSCSWHFGQHIFSGKSEQLFTALQHLLFLLFFFFFSFSKGILPPGRGQHGPWRLLWTHWSVEPRRPAGMAKMMNGWWFHSLWVRLLRPTHFW